MDVKKKMNIEDAISALKNSQELIDNYKCELERSQIQNLEAIKKTNEAETKRKEAEENLKKVVGLQNSGFLEVIKVIFEKPKTDLINEIIAQSKKSSIKTTYWAIISIIISVSITLYVSISTSNDKISEYLNCFENELSNMKELNRNMSNYIAELNLLQTKTAETSLKVGNIEKIITENNEFKKMKLFLEKESKNFTNFNSVNSIALAYKMRFVFNFPESKYSDFIQSLIELNVSSSIIPNINTLSQWDSDMIIICECAVNNINKIANKNSQPPNDFKYLYFGNCKSNEDKTNYSDWGYQSTDIKDYMSLYRNFTGMLNNFKTHKLKNIN